MGHRRASLVPYLLIPLVACGGGSTKTGDDVGPGGDDQQIIDAPSNQQCTVQSSYTYAGPSANIEAFAEGSGSDQQTGREETFIDDLNTDATPDVIQIQLFAGFGAYTGKDIQTGSVTIAGDELDLATCGACVFVGGDFDFDTGDPAQLFIASSGTIDVQDVGTTGSNGITTGNITVSLSNIQFAHITQDSEGNQVADDDGCTTSIASGTFTAPLQDTSGGLAPKLRLHRTR